MPVIDEISEDGDSTTVIEVVPKSAQQQQQYQQHSRQQQQSFRSLTLSNKLNSSQGVNSRLPGLQLQYYQLENCPPHPYHVNRHAQYSSIQHNSKKDSEIESISSSDSSLVCSARDRKSSIRNSMSLSNKTLAQRFQRPPPQQLKNQLLPTEDPEEFARKLIEKLNKVRSEQETDIKLSQALKSFERSHSPSLPGSSSSQQIGNNIQQREAGVGKNSTTTTANNNNNNNNQTSSSSSNNKSSNYRESGLGLALKNIDFSTLKNESGQAILDKHFAQVFETPNADSPSTSNQSTSAVPTFTHAHNNLQQQQQIHYFAGQPVITNSTAAILTESGNSTTSTTIHQLLPPPSPLSPQPHFINQFNSALSINSSANCVPIPAYVKFSNEEVPHKLTLMGPHITLLTFKQQIPSKRNGIQEFFFKRQSSESEKLDCGSDSLWINIKDDHQLLPQLDGKIHARVELN